MTVLNHIDKVLCLVLLWGFTSAQADVSPADLEISVAEILGYGVFTTDHSVQRSGYSKSKPPAFDVRGVRFVTYTHEIEAGIGINFGFEYSINTTPKGQKLPIRSVIRFPEPGLQQPGGRLYKESVENRRIQIGVPVLHGYGIDETWEIVPGEWVFEVWHKDARLIRKTFMVTTDLGSDLDSINE